MTARREAEVGGDRRDLAGVQDRVRRLHHRPDAGPVRRAVLPHHPGRVHDRARPVDLRKENGVRAGGGGDDKIVRPPGRVRPIDADDDLTSAEIALDRRDHLGARHFLGVGRDRIFQIEDQRVGRQCRGLGERLGVGAGHVEGAAARTGKHDDLLTTLRSI